MCLNIISVEYESQISMREIWRQMRHIEQRVGNKFGYRWQF